MPGQVRGAESFDYRLEERGRDCKIIQDNTPGAERRPARSLSP
jgi:hypothetical protein